MQRNGFYAAMKTDDGIRAVYIDENAYRAEQERSAAKKHMKEAKAERRKQNAARNHEKRAAIRVLKQELKLIGMGAVLYWGFTAGLVELSFAVPVLAAFQTVICFRAGRWCGRRSASKREAK